MIDVIFVGLALSIMLNVALIGCLVATPSDKELKEVNRSLLDTICTLLDEIACLKNEKAVHITPDEFKERLANLLNEAQGGD